MLMNEREKESCRDWVLRKWSRQESTDRVSSYCTQVYQMAFRAGRSFKEKGQVQTKQNKQESK